MIHIAEYRGYENNKHTLEITEKIISQEEFNSFYENFMFYSQYYQFKEIHDICLEQNIDLMKFLSPSNLNKLLRAQEVETEKVLQTGNKLLLNYCTVIKIMVEKIELYLKHNLPEKSHEFQQYSSNFYDQEFSYRFFMRLRNYIIHNGMPFTKVKRSLYEDCDLYIDRCQLLKWNKWSTVKKDLEEMDNNNIRIQPFLQDIGSTIYALYMRSLYYLAPNIINSIKNIENFCQKHKVKRFDFIEYDSAKELKDGKYQLHLVPWSDLVKCINEINKHPNININIKGSKNIERI